MTTTQRFRGPALGFLLAIVLGLFSYVLHPGASYAVGGYPGPNAGPAVPTYNNQFGTVTPGHTSPASYMCGFDVPNSTNHSPTTATAYIAGVAIKHLTIDSNGCVLITVTVFRDPKHSQVLLISINGSTVRVPVPCGKIDVVVKGVKSKKHVNPSNGAITWTKANVGGTFPFTSKCPPPPTTSTSTTSTTLPNSSTTIPDTTTPTTTPPTMLPGQTTTTALSKPSTTVPPNTVPGVTTTVYVAASTSTIPQAIGSTGSQVASAASNIAAVAAASIVVASAATAAVSAATAASAAAAASATAAMSSAAGAASGAAAPTSGGSSSGGSGSSGGSSDGSGTNEDDNSNPGGEA